MTATDSETLVGLIAKAAASGDASAIRNYLGELGSALDQGVALDHVHAHQLISALSQSSAIGGGSGNGPQRRNPYGLIAEISTAAAEKPVNQMRLKQAWNDLAPVLRDVHTPLSAAGCETLLQALRSARSFDFLDRTAEALFARGQGDTLTRRMYGQALIETGHPTAAIDVLNATLHMDALSPQERDQVQGLLGRAHKQIYVDYVRNRAEAIALRPRLGHFLTQAITHYAAAFDIQQPGHATWHGINLVALLQLAKSDGAPIAQNHNAQDIARGIIAALEPKVGNGADPWQLATLGEAYLALGNLDKAATYLGQFATNSQVDAFALQGTVRQLEQVWRLKAGSDGAGQILTGLKAALAAKDGSVVTLSSDERRLVSKLSDGGTGNLFETTIKGGEFVNLGLLKMIVKCGAAVAAVRGPDGSTNGTGFLLRGSDLNDSLGSELYLLTNAHVLWDSSTGPGDASALAPSQATIAFDDDAPDGRVRTYTCEKVWQSPSCELDATLVRFKDQPQGLAPIELADPSVALTPEDIGSGRAGTKLAVLGHPKGGPLALSVFGDLTNIGGTLVDLGPRSKDLSDPVYLRYRTPTEPGNSGSPVLEAQGWKAVGLHHAGFDPDSGKPRLAGKPGRELANEGISLASIRRCLKEELNPAAKKKPGPVSRLFGR